MNPRPFLILGASIAAIVAAPVSSRCGSAPAAPDFAAAFEDPAMEQRAMFRWWWPHGLVEEEQIRAEVRAMAEAGFGGAEIADVHHSVNHALAPDTHGWGTQPWVDAVLAALEEAEKHNFTIDLTLGPSWPVALPTITPDSPEAMKELAIGRKLVEAGETFEGLAPAPEVEAHVDGTQETLHLVQVAQVAAGANPSANEVELIPGTVRELEFDADSGEISWTAPDEGRWFVISYWLRGSGQRPEGGPHTEPRSYVVDHFSKAGAQIVIDYWEENILTPEMRRLLRSTGGAFFEDSIEMETDVTLWTPGLLEIFEERKGYSLLPWLPIIAQKDEDPIFEYDIPEAAHVVHDWWDVMGELFIEAHLAPLQEWAHTYGMKMRAQPYGMPTDAVSAAAYLDIVEGESLGFKNLDDFRSLAGGRDMGGKRILSDEAGAFAGGAYSTTWKRMLGTLNPIYASGVNQSVLHGYAYRDVPDVAWPGFAAFSPYGGGRYPGYAEGWSTRQPTWEVVDDVADYFGRVQTVLQQGLPRVDVAFLRQKGYAGSGFGAAWFSKEGTSLGWTHNFISPANLELPNAEVRHNLLALDGPAYQLLVFEGDAFQGRATTMPVETARKLLSFAEAGLPMLIVGDWRGPRTSGLPAEETSRELKAIFDALIRMESVVNVPNRESIPDGLEQLGLIPRVRMNGSPLVNAQRETKDTRFVYFSNPSNALEETRVCVEPLYPDDALFQLDPWTGEIKAQTFERHPKTGHLCTYVSVAPGSSLILAATKADRWGTLPEAPTFTEAPVALRDWKLHLESWEPGETGYTSVKVEHERDLSEPAAWTSLEGLADVSGVGTYSASFDWAPDDGALRLDLGEVSNAVEVRLNGEPVDGVNPMDPVVVLSEGLQAGENTLEVRVGSTLNNRLRVVHPNVFGVNQRQTSGLLGPVTLEK